MAKCFITGVEIDIRDAFILHVAEAKRALRDLKNRISALENLVDTLGIRDEVEVESARYGKVIKRKQLRVLSAGIANALSDVCPGRKLFIRLSEWQAARKAPINPTRNLVSNQSDAGGNPLRIVPPRGDDDVHPAI